MTKPQTKLGAPGDAEDAVEAALLETLRAATAAGAFDLAAACVAELRERRLAAAGVPVLPLGKQGRRR